VARTTEAQALKDLKRLFSSRVLPKLSNWDSYSKLMCLAYMYPEAHKEDLWNHKLPEAGRVMERYLGFGQRSRAAFDRTIQGYLAAHAYKGKLPVARGMHGLCVKSFDDVKRVVWQNKGRERDHSSYSLNVTAASQLFAGKSKHWMPEHWRSDIEFDQADYGARGPLSIRDCAGGSTKSRAMLANETPILICSRISPKDVYDLGGDSESGPLNEAEVHVRPYSLRKVEAVFVMTPHEKVGRAVTRKEARTYGLGEFLSIGKLSDWNRTFLHKGAEKLIPEGTVYYEHFYDFPPGYRWRRLR
jgi:hypothetical protein